MENKTVEVDAWFEEKVVNSLVEVSEAAIWAKELERFKVASFLPPEEKHKYEILLEAIVSSIYAALYDLSKVASRVGEGEAWEWEDRDEIIENGKRGLANILDKYGFSGWLRYLQLYNLIYDAESGEKIDVQATLRRVRELIHGDRENRTLIYIELRRIIHDSMARRILDLIEPVTQGEKSWPEFQQEADDVLKDV